MPAVKSILVTKTIIMRLLKPERAPHFSSFRKTPKRVENGIEKVWKKFRIGPEQKTEIRGPKVF